MVGYDSSKSCNMDRNHAPPLEGTNRRKTNCKAMKNYLGVSALTATKGMHCQFGALVRKINRVRRGGGKNRKGLDIVRLSRGGLYIIVSGVE